MESARTLIPALHLVQSVLVSLLHNALPAFPGTQFQVVLASLAILLALLAVESELMNALLATLVRLFKVEPARQAAILVAIRALVLDQVNVYHADLDGLLH